MAGQSPRQRIVQAAADIANRKGYQELNAKMVAARLRVSPPAIYKHFDSFDDLREALALRAFERLRMLSLEALAGRSGADAVVAVSQAYRRFAIQNPGELLATSYRRKNEAARMSQARVDLFSTLGRVFQDLGVSADRLAHAIRAYRSLIFGFLTLEAQGAFGGPEDPESSFHEAVQIFLHGIVRPEGGAAKSARL